MEPNLPTRLCWITGSTGLTVEKSDALFRNVPSLTMACKLSRQLRNLTNTAIHRFLLHLCPNSSAGTRSLLSVRCFSNGSSQTVSPIESSASPPSELPQPRTSPKIESGAASASTSSSLKEIELAKFAAIAETWWDPDGPFKPLHVMNPTRLAFIRSTLCRHFKKDPCIARPLEGLKIVDVGCGGGILSEPLARMGATVTGVDAVEKNIRIARLHADLDPVTSTIEYCCKTAEKLEEEGRKFDAVMDVLRDPAEFCKSLSALTVPEGATVISTINRSMRAYASAIVAAEYILGWAIFFCYCTAKSFDDSCKPIWNSELL